MMSMTTNCLWNGRTCRNSKNVQFRASSRFYRNGQCTGFSGELEDASGATASVNTDDYTNALFYPPGDIGTTLSPHHAPHHQAAIVSF